MNRKYSALAVSALALGAAGFAATDAAAQRVPEPMSGNATLAPNHPKYDPAHHGNMTTQEPSHGEYNYPEYKLGVPAAPDCHWAYHSACNEVPVPAAPAGAVIDSGPSDDIRAEAVQVGASALGGAALAFGGVWLYRRLHASAV